MSQDTSESDLSLFALSRELEAIADFRRLQYDLSQCTDVQSETREVILHICNPITRIALLHTAFMWHWTDDIGGMLVVSCEQQPKLVRQPRMVYELLAAVYTITRVTQVVIAPGRVHLRFIWDGQRWQQA
ncbi:hypothetical protein [Pantanalinema sp. GBBB05]|uniref:hypothetical protein n=1 Tax=Pantanalinema sp. GBBB05 TaxID=2604139 RepID=UPI001DCDEB67|nr:hypothetical protein [Pantanalinema sp. GBBB05]